MKRIVFKSLSKIDLRNVELPVSKSIQNRILILKYLSGAREFKVDDKLPTDVKLLYRGLSSDKWNLDFQDAGTAMRFATACFSVEEGEKILSGTSRMHERPIGLLVEALKVY